MQEVHVFEFPMIGTELIRRGPNDSFATVLKETVPEWTADHSLIVAVPLSDRYTIFYDMGMATGHHIPYNEGWEVFVRDMASPIPCFRGPMILASAEKTPDLLAVRQLIANHYASQIDEPISITRQILKPPNDGDESNERVDGRDV